MSLELIFAFVLFAFVTSVTPGPNNMMLLASGVNFGVRRSPARRTKATRRSDRNPLPSSRPPPSSG
jgi:hypothetical protein